MSKRTEKYGHKLQNVKIRVKDAEQGLVEAVFSTFNVIDSDGDVTLPGAFEEGAPGPCIRVLLERRRIDDDGERAGSS